MIRSGDGVGRRRSTLAAMLLFECSLAVVGCRSGSAPLAELDLTPTVRVAQPVIRKVTEYFYFTGRTEAVDSVDLKSRVTGYLESIDFTAGDVAAEGKQLFKVDPRPYQAKLDIALAQVKLAEARLKLADADYARAQALLRTPGAIAQADVDKYLAAQTEAGASVAAAQANAEAAALDLEYTTISAPMTGMVGRNYPSVGDLIKQDETLLTTMVSQDPMYAYFDVDEQTMLRVGRLIHEGKIRSKENGAIIPVEMALADEGTEYPHEGTMDFINNRISPSTGTLEVRAVLTNPLLSDSRTRMFTPGMFVRVRVPVGEPFDAILVPQSAIGTDQGRRYVLVVNDQDVVEQRVVELGPQQPGSLQVVFPTKAVGGEDAAEATVDGAAQVAPVAPLKATDRIIVGGLQLVRPGTKVKVR